MAESLLQVLARPKREPGKQPKGVGTARVREAEVDSGNLSEKKNQEAGYFPA
jgi:hypothetical protein